jgi:hypothetical protein
MSTQNKDGGAAMNQQPTPQWKPIAETLDKLKALPPGKKVIVFFPQGDMGFAHEVWNVIHWKDEPGWRDALWTPLPAPDPTREELVKAVVEAVVRLFNDASAHNHLRLTYATEAIISHDEAVKANKEKPSGNH